MGFHQDHKGRGEGENDLKSPYFCFFPNNGQSPAPGVTICFLKTCMFQKTEPANWRERETFF